MLLKINDIDTAFGGPEGRFPIDPKKTQQVVKVLDGNGQNKPIAITGIGEIHSPDSPEVANIADALSIVSTEERSFS